MQALEPALLAAARATVADRDPFMREVAHHLTPGLRLLQPQVVVRVFDEPEAHLHPSAQQRVARGLDALRYAGEHILIASHSPYFLDLPGWTQFHLHRGADEVTTVHQLPDETTGPRQSLAEQLGIRRGELLVGINAVLIVEGTQDRLLLDRFYAADLRGAGVAVVRMHGTNHLLATAELDFLDRYLDVPILLLLDNTCVDRVKRGEPVTDEERKLVDWLKSAYARDRPFRPVGLDRPDVLCYLYDDAVREVFPGFVGWDEVMAAYAALPQRPPFKTWLHKTYNVKLTTPGRIEAVLAAMEAAGRYPVGDLTRRVNELLGYVTEVE